ncbi:MAG: ATP synthase F1 subunit epsilon [Phototrophicaceae bacterium]
MPIHVEIVSQERKVFEEEFADMVLIPAVEGQMGVLPRHAPTVATLGFGELVVKKGNAQESFAIFGGVVDVRPGKVVVLAELASSSFDIDEEAAEAARARAQRLLVEGVPEDERRAATLELRRANLELQISRKMRASSSILRIVEESGEVES